jgi:membrane protein DedA with SNARE-associated domain
MLEILFLRFFYRKLKSIAQEKNRTGAWGALGVLLWITGEITGFMIAMSASHGGDDTGTMYAFALLGAVFGAVVAYLIVKSLSDVPLGTPLPTARVL